MERGAFPYRNEKNDTRMQILKLPSSPPAISCQKTESKQNPKQWAYSWLAIIYLLYPATIL